MTRRTRWTIALAAIVGTSLLGTAASALPTAPPSPTRTTAAAPIPKKKSDKKNATFAAAPKKKGDKGSKLATFAAAPKKKDDKKPSSQLAAAPKKKQDDKKGGKFAAEAALA